MTYRGWIINHDPLPLPPGHAEFDARREDWKPGDWLILRARSEEEAREKIDQMELCHAA